MSWPAFFAVALHQFGIWHVFYRAVSLKKIFIQQGKAVRFFPVDTYYVTRGSELKEPESNWQEVGLAKHQLFFWLFLETSEFLPAEDAKT